jgi:hypothetical protein
LVEVPNPQYSLVRLQEVFVLAAQELQRGIRATGTFADLLDPAHDAWAQQQVRVA